MPMTDFVSPHRLSNRRLALVAEQATISLPDVWAPCPSLLLAPHRTSTRRRLGNVWNPGRRLQPT